LVLRGEWGFTEKEKTAGETNPVYPDESRRTTCG